MRSPSPAGAARPEPLHTELIAEVAGAEDLRPGWDALADAAGSPQLAPDWILAWLRHVAGPDQAPCLVAVRDGERLVGLAPFVLDRSTRRGRTDLRLPGYEFGTALAPLAEPAREWEVASAVTAALATSRPRPGLIALEGLPLESVWREALREGWPHALRPASRLLATRLASAVVRSDESAAEVKQAADQARAWLERTGASWRWATPDSLAVDLEALLSLRQASSGRHRWMPGLASAGTGAMLRELGGRWLGEDRFRLAVVELDGEIAGAHLTVTAQRQALGVLSGWAGRHPELGERVLQPLVIADAFAREAQRFSFSLAAPPAGPGAAGLVNRREPLTWVVMLPLHRRSGLALGSSVPALLPQPRRVSAKPLQSTTLGSTWALRG